MKINNLNRNKKPQAIIRLYCSGVIDKKYNEP